MSLKRSILFKLFLFNSQLRIGRQLLSPSSSNHKGNVEKSRQRRSLPSRSPVKPALARKRPKRFAQAGRHFAVLTYSMYAPRVKRAAALLDGLF